MSSVGVGTPASLEPLPAGRTVSRSVRVGSVRRPATRSTATSPTTPTLLWAALLVVAALVGLTCATTVVSAAQREATATEITHRIEPLSADAATVYRALAEADTAVMSGYLRPGGPSDADQQRYDAAVAAAAAGLTAAAGRADDPATADRIAYLGRQLPVYTALVERARAGDGQTQAAGATYLDGASELMENAMLPVADSLQRRQARALSAAFDRTGSVPTAALGLALVTLACLVALQVVMARRFRRVLNAGLLGATVLLVLGLAWWTAASLVAGNLLAAADGHGRAVNEALVPAQVAVLQARTTEASTLVSRSPGARDRAFEDRLQRLARDEGRGGALGASTRLATDLDARRQIAAATAAVADYRTAHEQMRRAAADGRFADAAQLALTDGTAGASATFARIDASLAAAVGSERRAFADRMAAAQAWRAGLGAGSIALALAVVVVGAVAGGLGRRIRQYRDPLLAVPAPHRLPDAAP